MTCPLCEREVDLGYTDKHHLKTRKKDKHDEERICLQCHKTIHGLFLNTVLRIREDLQTVEGLKEEPQFAKALGFIRKMKPGVFMKMRQSKRR
ncbi:MAG: HNH endonuclease [Candidatus Thorarchaeota archaeon]|jgi:hypothetical protein